MVRCLVLLPQANLQFSAGLKTQSGTANHHVTLVVHNNTVARPLVHEHKLPLSGHNILKYENPSLTCLVPSQVSFAQTSVVGFSTT